jgi:hypothetical protein
MAQSGVDADEVGNSTELVEVIHIKEPLKASVGYANSFCGPREETL